MPKTLESTREMQGKPQDILRQLPEAFGGNPCDIRDDSKVVVTDCDGRRIELDITPQEHLVLGSLDLPMLQLTFRFTGYTPEEMEAVLDHFDTVTLRTGGP